jgi:hypothetical protein
MANHGGTNDDLTRADEDASATPGVSRRRAMQVGAGVAAGAWIAPAVLSIDAAKAATGAPGGGTISGTATSCQGSPLDGTTIFAVPTAGTSLQTTTAADGSFSFINVPPGDYTVGLQPSGFGGQPVTVTAGGSVTVKVSQLC